MQNNEAIRDRTACKNFFMACVPKDGSLRNRLDTFPTIFYLAEPSFAL